MSNPLSVPRDGLLTALISANTVLPYPSVYRRGEKIVSGDQRHKHAGYDFWRRMIPNRVILTFYLSIYLSIYLPITESSSMYIPRYWTIRTRPIAPALIDKIADSLPRSGTMQQRGYLPTWVCSLTPDAHRDSPCLLTSLVFAHTKQFVAKKASPRAPGLTILQLSLCSRPGPAQS